jgi:hypothetical protein
MGAAGMSKTNQFTQFCHKTGIEGPVMTLARSKKRRPKRPPEQDRHRKRKRQQKKNHTKNSRRKENKGDLKRTVR